MLGLAVRGTMVAPKKLEKIQHLVESLTEEMGLAIYDLSLSHGPRRPQLRVRVDRRNKAGQEDGITVEQLTRLSRSLDRALGLERILGEDYALEVSSPGLERPLKTEAHFEGAIGEYVHVVTIDQSKNKRRFDGVLVGIESGEVVVDSEEEQFKIPLDSVHRANTVYR